MITTQIRNGPNAQTRDFITCDTSETQTAVVAPCQLNSKHKEVQWKHKLMDYLYLPYGFFHTEPCLWLQGRFSGKTGNVAKVTGLLYVKIVAYASASHGFVFFFDQLMPATPNHALK